MAVQDIGEVRSRDTLVRYLGDLGYRTRVVPYEPQQLGLPARPSEAISSVSLLVDYDRDFQAYLFETTSLTRTTIRSILEPFYRHHPAGEYLFFFTKDYSELALVSPERILRPSKPVPALQLRILPVDPTNVYHTDLQVLEGIQLGPGDQTFEAIRGKHQEAFSIERVTDQFFKAYKRVLDHLKSILASQQKGNTDQVHAFAQQLLNRLMFLYFLQKKGWLKWGDGGPDKRYMRSLWRRYRGAGAPSDTFYSEWLTTLFFYVFNHPFGARPGIFVRKLPPEVQASFATMPFLNGGLFEQRPLDSVGFQVPDVLFVALFDEDLDGQRPGFLERYNFTVREDEPLEVEVAVDPEMLGKVYESLINEEDRHQGGIFYTPRVEIGYMCRLSLIDYLHESTELSKDVLIPFVMEPESEEALRDLTNDDLGSVRNALERVRVVDPAVGSGSFLVGTMNLLVRLYRAIAERLGRRENEFALKRRIISQNLYGVDVKDWAVRVCELRLWLSLIIESDETQMDIYGSPLLPNLTFKVRQGDSLVEEIAGVPLSLRADYASIPPPVKRRIGEIVEKKADYFAGNRAIAREDIEKLEHQLLREVLDSKVKALDGEIRKLEAPDRLAFQRGLEEIRQGPEQAEAVLQHQAQARAKVQLQIDALLAEKERLQQVAASVGEKGEKDYFLWDIDFAEVFLEKGGFDIVIGNPPYVRQEEIGPPLESAEDYDPDDWRERKRSYKERLETAVRAHWRNAIRKIDKKSDLYVYFYYLGLALLRPGGLFCFINSNSWLDVGYGASLQEFLLRTMAVRYVVDNHARRSFKESDINTVIVLLQRPTPKYDDLKNQVTKFLAFRVPFEAAVNSDNLQLIELAKDVESGDEYRVYPIKQEALWLDGLEVSEDAEMPSLETGLNTGKYVGSKWGGKYLRAPDIFFTILEKGKGKLVRLGDIAVVRRGFTTGANEFFYLEDITEQVPDSTLVRHGLTRADTNRVRLCRNGAGWEGPIETEFLKPVVKTPQEVFHVEVGSDTLKYKVLVCGQSPIQLKGTYVRSYITWGENTEVTIKQGTNKGQTVQGYDSLETLRVRPLWYDLGVHSFPNIVWVKTVDDTHRQARLTTDVLVDQRLYEVNYSDPLRLNVALNSTLMALVKELFGRVNLGEGALDTAVYEAKKMLIVDPCLLPDPIQWTKDYEVLSKRPIKTIFEELGLPKPNVDYSNVRPEDVTLDKVLPDRRALDRVVFDALGLTEDEQLQVYRAVVELVKNRLAKARSLQT